MSSTSDVILESKPGINLAFNVLMAAVGALLTYLGREIRLDIHCRAGRFRRVRVAFSSIARIYLARNGSFTNGSVYYDIGLERDEGDWKGSSAVLD